jgi:LasA protease
MMKTHARTQSLKRRPVMRAILAVLVLAMLAGCLPELPDDTPPTPPTATLEPTATLPLPTPLPARPNFQPGQLVEYTAQSGDTLEVLAARFNTSVAEIRAANTFIPDNTTTMPPGMPMQIPIYYLPLWGSPYQIIPDSLFVNGPAQVGFDAAAFVDAHPGWLKHYTGFVNGQNRRGGQVIEQIALNYSVSPRLLLALAEYQAGALSNPELPDTAYALGRNDYRRAGFYLQLAWAADILNKSYYEYRAGKLLAFDLLDRRMWRPDPWQNAGTVALQHYFARLLDGDDYTRAISSVGLAQTYRDLFGDPWENETPHLPGSLTQPYLRLPFEPGRIWAYTGGPHNAWGDEDATRAALDFAPPSIKSGCAPTDQWVTAMADGVIARKGTAIAILDLDGDGDERTGWVIFHLHLETSSIPQAGTQLKAGDRIGKPSCEGGRSTGTHVHIARKYNGEWMLADGALAFDMEGWVARNGILPYQGTLVRGGSVVTANTASDQASHIQSSGAAFGPQQ